MTSLPELSATPNRRTLLGGAGAALAMGWTGARAQPAWAPDRPVRVIVPFGPGGTSDVLARLLAERLSQRVGQSVIVENRGGAGGNIGTEAAARSAPDGLTLLFGGMSTNAINPALYPRKDVDVARDLTPVGLFISSANVLLVNPAKQSFASLTELLAAARTQPGRLSYGSNGNGSVTHLTMVLLQAAAGGLDILHVPYRGSATAGLLAGDVTMIFDGAASATQQVRGGALKALGVTTAQRMSSLPEVPTIAEAGVPGFDVPSWYAVFAPAGGPPAALERWRLEVAAVGKDPAFAALVERTGTSHVPMTIPGLDAFLAAERARWAEAVRTSGARID